MILLKKSHIFNRFCFHSLFLLSMPFFFLQLSCEDYDTKKARSQRPAASQPAKENGSIDTAPKDTIPKEASASPVIDKFETKIEVPPKEQEEVPDLPASSLGWRGDKNLGTKKFHIISID